MQTLRPSSDINAGTFTDQSGGTSNLYQKVDEVATTNDGDYVVEAGGGPSPVALRLGLSAGVDPGVDTGHTIYVRAKQGGVGETMAVSLHEGATTLYSITFIPIGGFSDYYLPLSSGNAAAITDYSALELRLNGLAFQVSKANLEIPEAGVTDHLDASGPGLVVSASGSGSYVEMSGPGLAKKSGTEGATALLQSGPGMVVNG